MEPRPQSTRAAQSQPTSRHPAAGPPPEAGGAYQQPDPTTMVAPPRTDYDYSPLDLAPPGQRRRRQLVAAAVGGLLMLVLVAAIVFAFLVLRDTDGDDGEADIAAAQTIVAATNAAGQAGTPDATEPPAEETQPAGETAGQPTATAGLDAAGEQAALDPTQPPAQTGGAAGPTTEQLTAMLPAAEALPISGLGVVEDSSLTQPQVVEALGGGRDAETKLTTWGWSGNATRSYTAPDANAMDPTSTTNVTVSLHGFGSDQAAAEALTFYSDVLLNNGYQEAEVGTIGATNRLLVQPQEDGGSVVALYVQQGPVLYRIGGYSPAGDPTTNVVNVAQTVISQQAAATGQ
jgi:hypothetical protein